METSRSSGKSLSNSRNDLEAAKTRLSNRTGFFLLVSKIESPTEHITELKTLAKSCNSGALILTERLVLDRTGGGIKQTLQKVFSRR